MTTQSSTLVHAHSLLNHLKSHPSTIEQLTQWVVEQYGQDVRFRTCSREGFSLPEMIDFFKARQKIIEVDGKWQTNPERVCNH